MQFPITVRKMMFCAGLSAFCLPAAAYAVPQFEYQITGTFAQAPDAPSAALEHTSYSNTYLSGGTNGGQEIYDGVFNITRSEIFSDPDITPTPYLYSNIQQFGFFGIYSLNTTEQFPSIFIAALPGTAASMNDLAANSVDPNDAAFDFLFDTYKLSHPDSDTVAELLQTLINGPDFPNPGEGQDWIDFNDFIMSNSPFMGDVGTNFQTAQTMELITFDAAGNASVFGDITTNANQVPEPAMLGLLAAVPMLLARRRR